MAFLDVEGARLHYELQGDGPTLLMTPGFATPQALWGPLLPALAERFLVVTHDVRGVGETEISTERSNQNELAGDLHALVQEVGGPVISLGHAFGAAITAAHAVRYADDVRAVVICSSGGLFASDPAAAANMVPLSTKRDLDAESYAKLFVETYCGAGFEEDPDGQLFLRGMFEQGQTREQMRLSVSTLGTLDQAYWGAWEQPTLLIYGTADRIAQPLNAFDLARRPHMELHWLRGAGHYAPVERPAETAELVLAFAEGLD